MPENISHTHSQKLRNVRYFPPPLELPVYGTFSPKVITYLGRTNYISALEEKIYVFGIKKEDRMKNIFVFGASGLGKSKMLETMIRQDVENGYGLILFDFGKDLFRSVLECISKKRINDVCILDFYDEKHLPDFNPFAMLSEKFKGVFLEDFLGVLSSYFEEKWNASLEYLFRMIVKTLLAMNKDNNLFTIQKLVQDKDYREKITNTLSNEQLKKFWLDDFPRLSLNFYKETILPLNNFLDNLFEENNYLMRIFCSKGTINLEELINQNKIILINLPFCIFSNRNANFLKELILLRLKIAGLLRLDNLSLNPFYVYFDDFEEKNNQKSVLNDLLEFSQKYFFSFTIATQSLSKISNYLTNFVFNNFCNMVIFGLNTADALRIEKEFATIKAKDIISLGKQEFYIKMIINQIFYEPFSGETLIVNKSKDQFASKDSLYLASQPFFL